MISVSTVHKELTFSNDTDSVWFSVVAAAPNSILLFELSVWIIIWFQYNAVGKFVFMSYLSVNQLKTCLFQCLEGPK